MKHIETFKSYSSEEKIDEGLGTIIKSILFLPLSILALILFQCMSGRIMSQVLKNKVLDIYYNIDTLIATIENILATGDVTDVERRKIEKKLKELNKLKRKYPTLDDYKKLLKKQAPYYNFRNRGYIRRDIDNYVPKVLNAVEIIKEIQKVYKLAKLSDIRDTPANASDEFWQQHK